MRGLPPPWPAALLHNKATSSPPAHVPRSSLLQQGSAQCCHHSLCPIVPPPGSKHCPGSSKPRLRPGTRLFWGPGGETKWDQPWGCRDPQRVGRPSWGAEQPPNKSHGERAHGGRVRSHPARRGDLGRVSFLQVSVRRNSLFPQQRQTLQIRKERHENRVWFLTAHLLQLVIPHLAMSSLQLLRTQQLPHAAPTPCERRRCSGRGHEAGTWESREKELPGPADGQSHHVPTSQVTHLVCPRSLLPKSPQSLGGPNRDGTGGLRLPAECSLPQIQDMGCPWGYQSQPPAPAPGSQPPTSPMGS